MKNSNWNFVDDSAQLGEDIALGRFCVVGANVVLGDGCTIGNGVVIHPDTIIGAGTRIDDNAVIGKLPAKAKISATTREQTLPPTRIGGGCTIGACVVIYRGAELADKILVADLSSIREDVTIGECTIVGRGVAIENFCRIGAYCKLETNVYMTAYSEVGDRCFVAPCVATSNDNYVGRSAERFKHYKGVTIKTGGRVGVGAVILPGKVIGEDTLVAAGALVTKDTPPKQIVAGVPARVFRPVPDDQLLENQ